MAAILAIADLAPSDRPQQLLSKVAQATTGQTTWLKVPSAAKFLEVLINVTATGGTTPILLPSLLAADPVTLNDTNTVVIGTAPTGGVTSTGLIRLAVGPGITGIADSVAIGATGGNVKLNDALPRLLGVKVLNDRTTGDETYTYTVSVRFMA